MPSSAGNPIGHAERAGASVRFCANEPGCGANSGGAGLGELVLGGSLAELHLEPAGQQILTLFKISKLVSFEEWHFETVKKLRAQQEQLSKEAKSLTGFLPATGSV